MLVILSWKEEFLKETIANLHFEVEKLFSLMNEVSFPCVEGVDVEDSIEGSQVSFLDAIETLIESDVDGTTWNL